MLLVGLISKGEMQSSKESQEASFERPRNYSSATGIAK